MSSEVLPRRVQISSIVSSRYPDGQRPLSWDERLSGLDVVKTDAGQELRLLSDGQQSPPSAGQIIMITKGDNTSGYRWTLFGIQ